MYLNFFMELFLLVFKFAPDVRRYEKLPIAGVLLSSYKKIEAGDNP